MNIPQDTKAQLISEFAVFGFVPTMMIAFAAFLIFLPLMTQRIPAWVRALVSFYPAMICIGLALIHPRISTIIAGTVVGLTPIWVIIFDRYHSR
jgi:hypothetical protein